MLQLHVPCMLFGVRLQDSPLAARVAANLGFAPRVRRLADRVIRALMLCRPCRYCSPSPARVQRVDYADAAPPVYGSSHP